MNRRTALILSIVAVAVGGCSRGEAPAPRFTVTDSAGIRIAHSSAPRWGRLRVTDRAFEFGAASGPEHLLFDRVTGVVRLEDGVLAVGNQGTNSIRLYRETGELLDEFGGDGEGPGEFTLLRGIRRCQPDHITAFDYNWRWTLFDREGRPLDSRLIRLPDVPFGPYELSCGADGSILATGWGTAWAEHPAGNYRTEAPLYRGEGPAGPFVQLGTTPADDRYRTSTREGPHPFGATTRLAHHPSGFVLATGDGYHFALHTMTGDTALLVRWDGPARPFQDEYFAAYTAMELDEVGEALRPEVRRSLEEVVMPDSLPAYDELRVAPSGVVWLRAFEPPGVSVSRWSGFLPSGEWAWDVELEPGFEVSEFGDDEVLGVATDDLGIESVRGYRLDLPRDPT